MRSWLFIILLLIVSVSQVLGQSSNAANVISGKILDESQQALPFASVILRSESDSLLQMVLSSLEGEFKIPVRPSKSYIVEVNMLGYTKYRSEKILIPASGSYRIGNIPLQIETKVLKEVSISGQKSQVEFSGDKKVYNVSGMASAGNTALDLLEKIPSIEVDQDKNVSYRGSEGIQVTIDGKETNASAKDILQSLPSTSVEKIEIIGNANARFDAAGSGAILNIVTTKRKNEGASGNITVGYGSWKKYSASAFLGYKKKKFGFSASASFRHDASKGGSEGYRKNFLADTIFIYESEGVNIPVMNNQSYRLGMDYTFNKKSSMSVSASTNLMDNVTDSRNLYVFKDQDGDVMRSYILNGNSNSPFKMASGNIGFVHVDESRGFKLSTGLTINYNQSKNDLEQEQGDSLIDPLYYSEEVLNERYSSRSENLKTSWNLDVEKSSGLNHALEMGLKISTKNIRSENSSSYYDSSLAEWKLTDTVSNLFLYPEQVAAAYAILKNKGKSFLYQIGCRLEHTFINPELRATSEKFPTQYFNLFPSLNLTYKLPKENQLLFSFSKRIERPDVYQLNPYVNENDKFNVMTGNPYLDPEFAYKTEFEHMKYFKNGSLNTSLFFTYRDQQISRIRTLDPVTGYSILSFTNYNSSINSGLELSAELNKWKWWTSNLNGSLFYVVVNADDFESGLQNEGISWSATFNNDFQLPAKFSISVNQSYRGPGIVAQGNRLANYNMDISARKSFYDNKLNVSLKFSDVFNTNAFGIRAQAENFEQYFKYKRQPQELYLSLTYRFGNSGNMNARKGSRESNPGEGMDGMPMDAM